MDCDLVVLFDYVSSAATWSGGARQGDYPHACTHARTGCSGDRRAVPACLSAVLFARTNKPNGVWKRRRTFRVRWPATQCVVCFGWFYSIDAAVYAD